jgi:hypothetical protein
MGYRKDIENRINLIISTIAENGFENQISKKELDKIIALTGLMDPKYRQVYMQHLELRGVLKPINQYVYQICHLENRQKKII